MRTTYADQNVQALYHAWRRGNSEAGQHLAQRYSDWFFAICTNRLGERRGHDVFQNVSRKFGEGIVKVENAEALMPWAHGILTEELLSEGRRVHDGDVPGAYTRYLYPKSLLHEARSQLPNELALIEAYYRGDSLTDVEALAAPIGGLPMALLTARHSLRVWLQSEMQMPFENVSNAPALDLAPLPVYEAGRMQSPAEEAQFEQWLLTDLDLCKNLAEFAHFAIALRGGVPLEVDEEELTDAALLPGQKHQLAFANLILVIGVFFIICSLFAFAFMYAFNNS